MRPLRSSYSPIRRGWTIIEILVVIAILSILIALAVVGLSRARIVSLGAVCQANIRSCSQLLRVYGNDYKDSFPQFAQRIPGNAFYNGSAGLNYSLQTLHWPLALRGYFSDRQADRSTLCPAGPSYQEVFGSGEGYTAFFASFWGEMLMSDYWISYATIFTPQAFAPGADVYDPKHFTGYRWTDVASPSRKGILIEPRAFHLRPKDDAVGFASDVSIFSPTATSRSYHVAYADGSVGNTAYSAMTPPETNNGWGRAAAPVLCTPDGIFGTDRP
jgi:prepilin-type N-terminal cleavage/methylation domain-containing protein